MAYPDDLTRYIYTPELGLQKEVEGVNITRVNGTFYLVKFRPIKAGLVNISSAPVKIGVGIIIVSKIVGMPNVYIAKSQNIDIVDTWGDLTHKKFKIKNLPSYRLNKVNISMYDTKVIESIVADFVTIRHGDVLKILKGITDSKDNNHDKNIKFRAVIESIIELGDNFFEVLKPYEESFLKVPDGFDTGNDKKDDKDKGNNTGNGSNTGDGSGSNTTKTVLGLSALGLALLAFRKKKKKAR